MKCITCNGEGIISKDMYHPSVVCEHCKGSGVERSKINMALPNPDKKVFDSMSKNNCPICGNYLCVCRDIEEVMSYKEKEDNINHPKHYTFGTIEVIDVIEDWKLGFHEGNCIKYIARAKYKGEELQDLKKAQWYLNRRIQDIGLDIEAGNDKE